MSMYTKQEVEAELARMKSAAADPKSPVAVFMPIINYFDWVPVREGDAPSLLSRCIFPPYTTVSGA